MVIIPNYRTCWCMYATKYCIRDSESRIFDYTGEMTENDSAKYVNSSTGYQKGIRGYIYIS